MGIKITKQKATIFKAEPEFCFRKIKLNLFGCWVNIDRARAYYFFRPKALTGFSSLKKWKLLYTGPGITHICCEQVNKFVLGESTSRERPKMMRHSSFVIKIVDEQVINIRNESYEAASIQLQLPIPSSSFVSPFPNFMSKCKIPLIIPTF